MHTFEEDELFPPENFAAVEPGVFRSGFPIRRNFPFLSRLGLRTVLTLVLEEYPPANCDYYAAHGIRLLQFGMEGNKEPFRQMPNDVVQQCVAELLDASNRPILIHCNEGKHRTGCLVGCLRRMRGWALSSIFDEYLLFAQSKARVVDQRFIELFDPGAVVLPSALALSAAPAADRDAPLPASASASASASPSAGTEPDDAGPPVLRPAMLLSASSSELSARW